jgi:hypothetical protein
MLVKGYWKLHEDGELRPVVDANVQTPDGRWKAVTFLLDAGADRTIIEEGLLFLLGPLVLPADESSKLSGIGGKTDFAFVQTILEFTRDDGKPSTVNGPFGIFTNPENSDLSVLGRDVTNNFDVIYSFPKREVLLLHPPHGYTVK